MTPLDDTGEKFRRDMHEGKEEMVIGEQLIVIIWHMGLLLCKSNWGLIYNRWIPHIDYLIFLVWFVARSLTSMYFLLYWESWLLAKGHQTLITFSVFSLYHFFEWVNFDKWHKIFTFLLHSQTFSAVWVFWGLSMSISHVHYLCNFFAGWVLWSIMRTALWMKDCPYKIYSKNFSPV